MSSKAADYNAQGNTAFKSGQFAAALELYSKAVQADPRTAKYHTNTANTLLKLNRAPDALKAAEAAIAADASWPKGHYFKAIALEQMGQLQQAVAACKADLQFESDSTAALKAALERIEQAIKQQAKEQTRAQQQRQQGMRLVTYTATVKDMTGQQQEFSFPHSVNSARLQRAVTDRGEATQLLRDVTMPHYQEMLRAKPWRCIACQKPATKLLLHPMAYLTNPEPAVHDFGPSAVCASVACESYCAQMVRQMMAELSAEMGAPIPDGGFVRYRQ